MRYGDARADYLYNVAHQSFDFHVAIIQISLSIVLWNELPTTASCWRIEYTSIWDPCTLNQEPSYTKQVHPNSTAKIRRQTKKCRVDRYEAFPDHQKHQKPSKRTASWPKASEVKRQAAVDWQRLIVWLGDGLDFH